MNLNIARKNIIYTFICINYIVDILNGVGAFFFPAISIAGTVIRGGIVILGALLIRGVILRWLCVLILLFIVYSIYHLVVGSNFDTALELQQIMKIIFPICFSSIIFFFCKNIMIEEKMVVSVFSISGLILSIGVIISILLGVETETYTEGSFGQKGIMLNQNDMALLFSIAIFYSSYGALKYSKIFILNCALCMVAAILLGTRLGVLSVVIFPIAAYIFFIRSNDVSAMKKLYLFPLCVCGCAGVGFFTFWLVINDSYLMGKFFSMLEGGSPRGRLFDVGLEIISNSTYLDYLFGRSATSFYDLVQNEGGFYSHHDWGKRVEVDPIDIIGCYGVVIYLSILLILFKPMVAFVRKINETIFGMLAFILFFIFLHSIFLGHVVTQPITGAILGFILFLYLRRDNLLISVMEGK